MTAPPPVPDLLPILISPPLPPCLHIFHFIASTNILWFEYFPILNNLVFSCSAIGIYHEHILVSRVLGHLLSESFTIPWVFVSGLGIGGSINLTINKAKAISAELLELSLKNKLEETGKTR